MADILKEEVLARFCAEQALEKLGADRTEGTPSIRQNG